MSHTGPDYSMPSELWKDETTQTSDNANGGSMVTWKDAKDIEHTVSVKPGNSITVCFPIPYGGLWYWKQADGSW